MKALLILLSFSFAGQKAMDQAVDCAEGRCWSATNPDGTAVTPNRRGAPRPNITYSRPQEKKKAAPPPTREKPEKVAAASSDSSDGGGEEQKSGLAGLWQSFKNLGKLAMDNAAPLLCAGVLGLAGGLVAGPWGAVAGVVVGLMVPGLLEKATKP